MKCKQFKYLLYFVLVVFTATSCRSWKDLIYMKDVTDQEFIPERNDSTIGYLIRPGDILFISIKSINPEVNALFNPESNMESESYSSYQKYATPQGAYLYGYEIDQEGSIKLPILGIITVSGLNQFEAETFIQNRANLYLKDAIVKVKLLSYKVTVIGEVRNPGIYYNYSNSLSVLEAIAMANGNTDYANIKQVLVIRKKPGGVRTYRLNVRSKEVWKSEAFYLFPNDYVLVEPVKDKNVNLNSQAYAMFVSSASILLAILGFVLK